MASNSLNTPLHTKFIIPAAKDVGAELRLDKDSKSTYLCGNSLGLPSTRSMELVQEELDAWAKRAVTGHFQHPQGRPWAEYCDHLQPLMAEIVGAQDKEVACMSTLTANLHLMMDSFYEPTCHRYKILCEAHAFPSDRYAFTSQVKARGLDPDTTIIYVSPRKEEYTLREDDILEIIRKEGPSIALVLFSGVQYLTGQFFPMELITRAAKDQGCICGWDLAHAVGNVPLKLHDWDVDFAVWCTYKYLNSSPGGIAGLFVHEKWDGIKTPRSAGWWGHDPTTRFSMPAQFSPIQGAHGFQQSNPCILGLAALLGSLQVFKETGMMKPIRERSVQLTAELDRLLRKSKYFISVEDVAKRYSNANSSESRFTIITPQNPAERGAQLSLLLLPPGSGVMHQVFRTLCRYGVIGDGRDPDVIRLTPAPLYNTVEDCERAVYYLDKAFRSIATLKNRL